MMMKFPTILVQLALPWLMLTSSSPVDPSRTGAPDEPGFKVLRPSFPDREFVITDFGAVNDGVSLNTESINRAIESCHAAGGGRVVIPSGVWVTGPIQLKSNVDLHVEEGAVVLFSKNFNDYPFVDSYFEGRMAHRAMPLIFGDSLSNIAITGKGVFDGSGEVWRPVKKMKTTESQWRELVRSGGVVDRQGNTWWPDRYAYEVSQDPEHYSGIIGTMPDRDLYKAYFRPPLVQLISCERVLLEGPLFQNSPFWCIHPIMCSHVTVNEVMVVNPWYAQNGDGIDVESCNNVSIRNSHFDVGDDAICIKSGRDEEGRRRGMPTRDLIVDNCIVHHGHGGFVVGSEMSGGVKDVWVSNCTFLGTDVGLRFKSNRGRGGVVENINIDNIRMIDIATDAIIFNLFYAGLAPTEMGANPFEKMMASAPEISEETPVFRNISISHINCQGADHALQILGLPEMPVHGLSLKHSVFSTERGIQCLFAKGLTIEDALVRTRDHPAVTLQNVEGARILGVEGNHETTVAVEGPASKNIVIGASDPGQLKTRTLVDPRSGEGTVRFERWNN
jgi:polygalacturonase